MVWHWMELGTIPAQVYRLIAQSTVDERAAKAISDKKSVQQSLLDSLSELVKKYKNK